MHEELERKKGEVGRQGGRAGRVVVEEEELRQASVI